jgi:hypothetical protein
MGTEDARLIDRISQQLDAGVLPREHPKKIFGATAWAMPAADAAIACVQVKGSLNSRPPGEPTGGTSAALGCGKANRFAGGC